ncbi:uncharacterized protein F5Z01DRAFT_671307 [Emericellopsis atlantica]|uniref:Uncharacterized protein n=1 Tax=Emericellopsis atlantica TaxID=2614577 RepID=A0A9P7ZTY3_9HYPO|nr:uncharacterized protein F5Z01DRAFT_671307 [Emericellopsis atlantica]KAG9257717.1 hypothetical protein F5Z01DRAFT_671307 [Emericellopsis atlantica]
MSGGGGFYKYRCKYFYYEDPCPNWVWVKNAPCAKCLSEGRDDEPASPPQVRQPAGSGAWDIIVPDIRDGVLQYTLMEMVAPTDNSTTWTLREKVKPPPDGVEERRAPQAGLRTNLRS